MSEREFGVLPVPSWLRHNPDKPLHFGLLLNTAFGVFATFTVANLHYCVPILGKLAEAFEISEHEAGNIATLVQSGYTAGLLLLTPLGDLVQRRQLLLIIMTIGAALTIGLAITKSLIVFETLNFLVGMASVTPQILVPFAADLAPAHRRTGAIGIVYASLLLGVLLARVLSGVIANFVSYRNVYWMATGLQFVTLGAAYLILPNLPKKDLGLTYFGTLASMAKLAVTQPLLIQSALCIFTSNMCFTNFWVTLTFLLLDKPYQYSSLDIGLFGLLGMLGIMLGPFISRRIDYIYPWWGAFIAVLALLVFQAVMVIGAGLNVSAIIIATLGLDVFRQTVLVSNTTMAFAVNPDARSRINAIMTVALFVGQVVGTSVSTTVFFSSGWRACYALALGWTGLQLIFLLLRGPHCPHSTWLGWSGGAKISKPPHSIPSPTAVAPAPEDVANAESAAETRGTSVDDEKSEHSPVGEIPAGEQKV